LHVSDFSVKLLNFLVLFEQFCCLTKAKCNQLKTFTYRRYTPQFHKIEENANMKNLKAMNTKSTNRDYLMVFTGTWKNNLHFQPH